MHPNRDPVEHAAFSSMGEYAYSHEKQREAFDWIGTHPVAFMRASMQRVKYFWFDRPYPLSRFARPGAWFWKVKFLYICALLVMSLTGLVTIWRKRREYFWLLAALPVIFPLLYYATLAYEFHRFPIDPILAIIAAFAVTAWLPTQPC